MTSKNNVTRPDSRSWKQIWGKSKLKFLPLSFIIPILQACPPHKPGPTKFECDAITDIKYTADLIISETGMQRPGTCIFDFDIAMSDSANWTKKIHCSKERCEECVGDSYKELLLDKIVIDSVSIDYVYSCDLPVESEITNPSGLTKNYQILFPTSCDGSIDRSDAIVGTIDEQFVSDNSCKTNNFPQSIFEYYVTHVSFWSGCSIILASVPEKEMPFLITDNIENKTGDVSPMLIGNWTYELLDRLAFCIVYKPEGPELCKDILPGGDYTIIYGCEDPGCYPECIDIVQPQLTIYCHTESK